MPTHIGTNQAGPGVPTISVAWPGGAINDALIIGVTWRGGNNTALNALRSLTFDGNPIPASQESDWRIAAHQTTAGRQGALFFKQIGPFETGTTTVAFTNADIGGAGVDFTMFVQTWTNVRAGRFWEIDPPTTNSGTSLTPTSPAGGYTTTQANSIVGRWGFNERSTWTAGFASMTCPVPASCILTLGGPAGTAGAQHLGYTPVVPLPATNIPQEAAAISGNRPWIVVDYEIVDIAAAPISSNEELARHYIEPAVDNFQSGVEEQLARHYIEVAIANLTCPAITQCCSNPPPYPICEQDFAAGGSIYLEGVDFGAIQGTSTVEYFAGGDCGGASLGTLAIVSWSDTLIEATLPAGIVGTFEIGVLVSGCPTVCCTITIPINCSGVVNCCEVEFRPLPTPSPLFDYNAGTCCIDGYTIRIADRNGFALFDIEEWSTLTGDPLRVVDRVSDMVVTIEGANCPYLFDEINDWEHELQVFRNQGLIWAGPIQSVRMREDSGGTSMTVRASDILEWLARRLLQQAQEFRVESDKIASIFATVISEAMAVDDIGLNANANFITLEGERRITAYATAIQEAIELGRDGLDFTMLGRQFLVGNEEVPFNNLPELREEHMDTWAITKDGSRTATRVIVLGGTPEDSETGRVVGAYPATRALGVDGRRGLIERRFYETSILDQDSANAAAFTRWQLLQPPHLTFESNINVCEWGANFNDIIAGAKMSLAMDPEKVTIPFRDWRINRVGLDVRRSGVTESGIDETINIQLQPEGTINGDLEGSNF